MTKIRRAARWIRAREGWKLWASVAVALLAANMLIVNGAFVWERQAQIETNDELRDQLEAATAELECRAVLNNAISDSDADASIAILEGLIAVAQQRQLDPELIARATEIIAVYRGTVEERREAFPRCHREDPP